MVKFVSQSLIILVPSTIKFVAVRVKFSEYKSQKTEIWKGNSQGFMILRKSQKKPANAELSRNLPEV
jgi:hypothetical protein